MSTESSTGLSILVILIGVLFLATTLVEKWK